MNIGILGSGQLAKMLISESKKIKSLAAKNPQFFIWDEIKGCASSSATKQFTAPFDCKETFDQFSQICDVITYEFEQVNLQLVQALSNKKPLYPNAKALKTTQDRLLEKQFCNQLGIATSQFLQLSKDASTQQFDLLTENLHLPFLIKSRKEGYDGKHQYLIHSLEEWQKWLNQIESSNLEDFIAEQWIDFDYETSIVATRSICGDIVFYDMPINTHQSGILFKSEVEPEHSKQQTAQSVAKQILDYFDYVGTLAIEFFVLDGNLMVNEMAPRVHNTGHWSIEGANASQFENHIRAICNLPLKKPKTIGYPAMINLIGTINLDEKLLPNGAVMHCYGKKPRKGRKLGHIGIVAKTENQRNQMVEQILSQMGNQVKN